MNFQRINEIGHKMEVHEPEKAESWLPLAGHILFVSIRKRHIDERDLQKKIQLLGGKLETFFSREITCVLTDDFPVPTKKDKLLKRNLNGKLLGCETKRSSIVEKAKSLGIDIMRFESFLSWLNVHVNLAHKDQDERNVLKPTNMTTLNGCFVKVENGSHNYCPLYKTFPETPDSDFERLYYENLKLESDSTTGSVSIKLADDSRTEIVSAPEKSCSTVVSSEKCKKIARKPKRQYCECCSMYYTCLDKHLKGPSHTKFIGGEDNFKQLAVLTNDLTNVTELKQSACKGFSSEMIKSCKNDAFEMNRNPTKPVIECHSPNKSLNSFSEIGFKKSISTSYDSFNELLKMGINENSFIKTELEEILSPIEPTAPTEISTNTMFAEKSLLKEELNFNELFPSDILPDNDRLFSSSDISDEETIQQNVANIIDHVFKDGVLSENSNCVAQNDSLDSDSSTINVSGYSDCESLSVGSEQSDGSTKDGETFFRNLCFESWSVKQISEVKMLLVRCSLLSSVPYVTAQPSDDSSSQSWKVKNREDTKIVFTRSDLGLTEVAS